MPRRGPETGYVPTNVCGYCIEHLNITAGGKNQLKSLPIGRLRKYANAYDIRIDRAVEKDDIIDAIVAARVRVFTHIQEEAEPHRILLSRAQTAVYQHLKRSHQIGDQPLPGQTWNLTRPATIDLLLLLPDNMLLRRVRHPHQRTTKATSELLIHIHRHNHNRPIHHHNRTMKDLTALLLTLHLDHILLGRTLPIKGDTHRSMGRQGMGISREDTHLMDLHPNPRLLLLLKVPDHPLRGLHHLLHPRLHLGPSPNNSRRPGPNPPLEVRLLPPSTFCWRCPLMK
ncbi:hypothetical protein MD484_g5616, partial [Candolleomyces efflorescens]